MRCDARMAGKEARSWCILVSVAVYKEITIVKYQLHLNDMVVQDMAD